mmetsp:Transcript_29007/g.61558  ORF Transcript_29007/g.61558 Transcript_29007/m.61558 type:complete len:309 (+) Transcript_29007:100-1026(+)
MVTTNYHAFLRNWCSLIRRLDSGGLLSPNNQGGGGHPRPQLLRNAPAPRTLDATPRLAVRPQRIPPHDVMKLGVVQQLVEGRPRRQSRHGRLSFFVSRHLVPFIQRVPVFWKFDLWGIGGVISADDETLRNGEEVGREPVYGQSSWNLERKESDHEGQKLQDSLRALQLLLLLLGRGLVLGRLEDVHGEALHEYEDHGHDEEGQRTLPAHGGHPVHPPLRQPLHASVIVRGRHRALQRGDPKERLVQPPLGRESRHAPVQSQEDRDLREGRDAPRQRVLLGVLVKLPDGLVLHVLVGVLLLDLLLIRL